MEIGARNVRKVQNGIWSKTEAIRQRREELSRCYSSLSYEYSKCDKILFFQLLWEFGNYWGEFFFRRKQRNWDETNPRRVETGATCCHGDTVHRRRRLVWNISRRKYLILFSVRKTFLFDRLWIVRLKIAKKIAFSMAFRLKFFKIRIKYKFRRSPKSNRLLNINIFGEYFRKFSGKTNGSPLSELGRRRSPFRLEVDRSALCRPRDWGFEKISSELADEVRRNSLNSGVSVWNLLAWRRVFHQLISFQSAG